jgi:hypothetical protein
MSVYARLGDALRERREDMWKVGFDEVERLIGRKLPASARKYPAWWSNDPSNNSMTKVWLRAGWRSEQVDVQGETVVFRRAPPAKLERKAFGLGDAARPYEAKGFPERPRAKSADPLTDEQRESFVTMEEFLADLPADHPLADIYGALKGSMTFAPDFDPGEPAFPPEEWAEAEAEMEKEWDELYGSRSEFATGARKRRPSS